MDKVVYTTPLLMLMSMRWMPFEPEGARGRFSWLFLVAAMLASAGSPPLWADTYAWIGRPPGNGLPPAEHYLWHDPFNWSPLDNAPPNQDDSAYVMDTMVQVLDSVTVTNLGTGQVTVFGPGAIEVLGQFDADRTRFLDANGPLYAVYPDQTPLLIIQGAARWTGIMGLSRKVLNYGTARLVGTRLGAANSRYHTEAAQGAIWENLLGSELELTDGAQFTTDLLSPGTGQVRHRAGARLRKTGSSHATIEWPLESEGRLEVEGGRLVLYFPTRIAGTVSVMPGTELFLNRTGSASKPVVVPIEGLAGFEGAGEVVFEGSAYTTWQVTGPRDFLCRTRFINGVVDGDPLTFWWPSTWHTGSGTVWGGSQRAQFLAGGAGKGTVLRTLENFGEFEDLGINSEVGASFLNQLGRYYVGASSTTGAKAQGWLTNRPTATVQFTNDGAGSHLRWSLHNEGSLGFGLGARARILGSLVQAQAGLTTLSSNTLSIQSNLFLAGELLGSGSITAYHAQVTGVLSPGSGGSPFGRLEIRSLGATSVGATNRIRLADQAVLEIDLGVPGTTNDFFRLGSLSGSAAEQLAGRLDVRIQPGFAPGTFPFLGYVNGPNHQFRFGAVPPGYRFGLATNAAARTLSIVVTATEEPIASLEARTGVPVGALRIRTVAGMSYIVDYTEEPGVTPWKNWTNFVGEGQSRWLPFEPASSRQFFRVQEGP